ncbi:hypothetical protein Mal52_03400 [Symmachiella dynata]|uniref:Uncharacterized protein n=1 Tax=Symmachiella dynata TaxID=2527995 RepID=A0A517ZHD0_9PLAN|nr:hypothetical protein [Symmachiella dynata]QDU41885.1 hypothetical protein Mal52_03400 [Symmachiella dynata]
MHALCTLTFMVLLTLVTSTAQAEGLIHQLPKDGAWVRYDVSGEAKGPDGAVKATLKGTLTISSVGETTVDNEKCRWIELDTQIDFKTNGGREGKQSEVLKLLIPEKFLTKNQNPIDQVLKAYKKNSQGTIQQLDPKDSSGRSFQGMDEFFHSPLKQLKKLEAEVVETKLGKLKCEGWQGRETKNETVFKTQTRLHEKAPFGVVSFRYEKERIRNGQSNGKRDSVLKLVDYGKNAKSQLSDSQ